MAENADGSDMFKDLLSAALEESGLNDDLVDFSDFGFENASASTATNINQNNHANTSTVASSLIGSSVNINSYSAESGRTASSQNVNVTASTHGTEGKTATQTVSNANTAPQTTHGSENSDHKDANGGDELDFFSQALMQLTATNKEAEVHEQKVKKEQQRYQTNTVPVARVTKPASPVTVVKPQTVTHSLVSNTSRPSGLVTVSNPVSTPPVNILRTPQAAQTLNVPQTTPAGLTQVVTPQSKVTRVMTKDGKIAHILTPQGKVLQLVQPQGGAATPERRVRQVITQDGKIAHLVSTPTGANKLSRVVTPQGRVAHVITPQGKVTVPLSQVLNQAGGRSSPITILSQKGPLNQQTKTVLTAATVGTSMNPQSPVPLTALNQSPQVARILSANSVTRSNTPPPANAIKIVTIGPKGVVQANGTRTVAIPRTSLIGNKINLSTSGMDSPLAGNRVIINSTSSPFTAASNSGFVTVNSKSGGSVLMNRVVSQSVPGTITSTNGVIKTQLTSKDVSRLWANDDISLKSISGRNASSGSPVTVMPVRQHIEEEVEEEDEELGHAETYAEYMPTKLKVGQRHPDPVVETSSLSSVEPPDVWYGLSIPESTIDYGSLSALQLESITYCCQRHDTHLPSGDRAGYLIGDGAGVGKGRTIAGIIFENYLQGRKRALWLSVSNDLKVDAERDLRDIGAGKIDVHPLNKFKYAKISSKENGSVKKGVIFATYSSLIGESQSGGKYRTRFKQLVHWLGKDDFDGVIVFDECHKAKNLCPVGSSKPTKTGLTVLELQNKLPRARIIYASATGASEPKNMAYMTRLGLWGQGTPFREFTDFIQAVEKRGVGAMELVAMDMKLRGMYIARQLSFHGVSFKVEEIPISKDFIHVYNQSVRVWVEAREKFQMSADLIDAEHRMRKTMWGQFWSAHQRFFKYLCISAKVKHCIRLAREAVKNGKCVVIGLQSTGEARTLEQLEENGGELNDFVSTAKGVLQTLVEKHFPAPDRRRTLDSLFGFKSMLDDDILKPKNNNTAKRKLPMTNGIVKKARRDESDDSSDSDNNDFSLSSSSSDSDADSDDFNPFGCGSDSDDDPWLKKSKAKKKKKPKKKKKKEKKTKKKKKDSDDEMDEEFDKALEEAGLMSKSNLQTASFSNKSSTSSNYLPGMDAVDKAIAMKRELLQKIEKLGDILPANTLDELIDSLGGPENVAEMTGRKGRVVSTDEGNVVYESRSEIDAPLETLNLTEKQRFMDGEKNIAIISEAASSGISLQADRRAVNQRRRVHITLELPWSADRAIQQFGRTHRSNQVSAPEYIFMISDLAGERRFASTVAKRLESLGALTHGDRRATETRDLSRFNIDNKYGRTALEAVMKSILEMENPIIPYPVEYPGKFTEDITRGLVGVGMVSVDERFKFPQLEKDYNNMSKFLNRILGLEVTMQNFLFKYFTDTLAAVILQAKRNGRWDLGILDLGSGEETVKKVETKSFVGNFGGTNIKTHLHTILVERGLTWMDALEMWEELSNQEDGFYLSTQMRNGKRTGILVVGLSMRKNRERLYRVYRPNTGLQVKTESITDIRKKYRKVLPDEVKPHWQDQFHLSADQCIHTYWHGSCKKISLGLPCEIGLRCRKYHVLGGSVLGVWTKVEAVLASMPGGHASRMQIIRLKTDDGERIVGSLIPTNCLAALSNMLSQDSNKTVTQQHCPPPLPTSAHIPPPESATHLTKMAAVEPPAYIGSSLSMPIIL